MRKEIIRLENIHAGYNGFLTLKQFHMQLFQGECLGIVENNETERDTLIQLLTGELAPVRGRIFSSVNNTIDQRKIHVIGDFPSMIENMTIAENLFVVRESKKFKLLNAKLIFREAQNILDEFDIKLNAKELIRHLTKTERRMVEILKAYVQHAEVIIMQNILADYSVNDQLEYLMLQRALQDRKVSFLLIDSNIDILKRSCDRLLYLGQGHSLKVYEAREFYLDEDEKADDAPTLMDMPPEESDRHREIFRVENVSGVFVKNMSFQVKEGEIVSIGNLTKNIRTELIYFLIGRHRDYRGTFFYQNQEYVPESEYTLKRDGIGVLRMQLPLEQYIFPDLSVLENLFIGSLNNMSHMHLLSKKMIQLVQEEYRKSFEEDGICLDQKCGALDSIGKWKTCLCRMELQHPRLLICEEAFAIGNDKMDRMVQEFLVKMRKFGTALLLISSNDRKLREISDVFVTG